MRILQVCSARTLGGGERHVATLANALTQRGHEVFLAVAPNSPLIEKLAGIPAQNIITVRMRNALDIPSALKIASFVRQKEIEIVHAHLARDYPLASVSTRRFAQLIVTRHVLFSLNRLHRLTLSRVARVIAVSKAVANRLLAQRICDERKIQVIPNGIELQRFEKPLSSDERQTVFDKLGLTGSHLVGSVGSLLPLKGHEEFIRAAAIVVGKVRDVEFVIIGDDDERNRAHRDYLERLITELGLQERVHLVHWTDDLSLFYRALDVYVSASHSEAFGLSIVEAMASGRSVVATATDGAKEIIDDGKTGTLVPIGNAEKLAESIAVLLANDGERSRLGANAREDARLRFSLEGMVSAVEEVYREVIGRR